MTAFKWWQIAAFAVFLLVLALFIEYLGLLMNEPYLLLWILIGLCINMGILALMVWYVTRTPT